MRKLLRLGLFSACAGAGLLGGLLLPVLPAAARARLQKLWCRAVLASLGLRLGVEGEPAAAGALLVANHVSWLDVVAIAAAVPAGLSIAFLCKDEIAAWPVVGWLLRRAGTLFMRRGSARAAWRAVKAIGPRLGAGASLAVFPEGTTTLGGEVLPFYPALFQAAVHARAPVQPVALLYVDSLGRRSEEAAYEGETSFGESLLAVAGAGDLAVRVAFLPAFSCARLPRRQAAALAHAQIASRIRHAAVPVRSREGPILRPA